MPTTAPATCSTHQAFIVETDGGVVLGELTDIVEVVWGRIRDSISTATVKVGTGCCDLLDKARTVKHELHIYRDGVGVWEGPIIRLAFDYDIIEIAAEDMLWVTKRRALERAVQNTGKGIKVLEYAEQLLGQDCYAKYGDYWNMVGHINVTQSLDDLNSAASVNAWQYTIWEVLDSLAQHNGIDYCVVNRDIYVWDIHVKLWEIEPMLADHISEFPRITEYGTEFANRYIRTDGSGGAGVAAGPQYILDEYGTYVDLLANSTAEDEEVPGELPSPQRLRNWTEAAERQVWNHFPPPVRISVPANSTLTSRSPWDVNTLKPGSWSKVFVEHPCRTFEQWQRLDELRVTETGDEGEIVNVSLGAAPVRMVQP